MLHAKELLPVLEGSRSVTLRELVRPLPFVVESAHVSDVLAKLRQCGTHMAFVLDEYGQIAGLVTMEDLLEEMVGEILDEYDEREEPPFVQRDDGSWLVDGAESFDKVKLQVGLPEHENETLFTTIAGMVMADLNRVPEVGDSVQLGEFIVEVVDMDGRRIDKVLIQTVPRENE
jgi:putative hemolysin